MKPRKLSTAQNKKAPAKAAPAHPSKPVAPTAASTAEVNVGSTGTSAPAQYVRPETSDSTFIEVSAVYKDSAKGETEEKKRLSTKEVYDQLEALAATYGEDGTDALRKKLMADPHLTGALYSALKDRGMIPPN